MGRVVHRLLVALGVVMFIVSGCAISEGPVHGARDGFVFANVGSYPNVPIEWDVEIVNNSNDPVTVTDARLLDLPHYASGRLAHIARVTRNSVGIVRGWPDKDIEIAPLLGAKLPAGRSDLVVAMTGSKVGHNYGAAGVEITYKVKGKTYKTNAWGSGVACVTYRGIKIPQCSHRVVAQMDAVDHYIKSQQG